MAEYVFEGEGRFDTVADDLETALTEYQDFLVDVEDDGDEVMYNGNWFTGCLTRDDGDIVAQFSAVPEYEGPVEHTLQEAGFQT